MFVFTSVTCKTVLFKLFTLKFSEVNSAAELLFTLKSVRLLDDIVNALFCLPNRLTCILLFIVKVSLAVLIMFLTIMLSFAMIGLFAVMLVLFTANKRPDSKSSITNVLELAPTANLFLNLIRTLSVVPVSPLRMITLELLNELTKRLLSCLTKLS